MRPPYRKAPEAPGVACGYRHHARWTDAATARYVAEDMTKNDDGEWIVADCPGEPNAAYPEHGPHWHVVLKQSEAGPQADANAGYRKGDGGHGE